MDRTQVKGRDQTDLNDGLAEAVFLSLCGSREAELAIRRALGVLDAMRGDSPDSRDSEYLLGYASVALEVTA